MFQPKQIEEYQNITAPTELKDRVRFSVKKARRTMRQRIVAVTAVAAGITLFFVSRSLLGNSSTILSVNDVVVTREALLIDHQDAVLLTTNMGQQRSLPIHIPMEIQVDEKTKGKTQIEVNVGTLIQVIDENQYAEETTKLEISETAEVYWMLDENVKTENPVCTITSNGKVYKYMVEYQADTEAYSIRKTN